MLGARSPLQGLFKAQGVSHGGGEEAEEGRAARGTAAYRDGTDGYHNENDSESEAGGPSVQPGKPSVQRNLFTQANQGQGNNFILTERPNEAAPSPVHRTGKAPTRGAAFDPLRASRRRAQHSHGAPMVLDYQDPAGPKYYASGKRGGGSGSSPLGSGSPPSALAILEAQGLMGPAPTRGVPADSSDTHSLAPSSSITSEGPFRRSMRAPSFGRRPGTSGGAPRGGHAMWGGASRGLGGGGGAAGGGGGDGQAFADTSSVASGAHAVGLGPTQSTTSNSSRMSETHRWLADAGRALGWSPSTSQSQSQPHEPGMTQAHFSLPRGDADGIPEEGPATPPGSRMPAGGSIFANRPRTAPPKKQWGAEREGPGAVGPAYGAPGGLGSPATETPQRNAWRARWARRGVPSPVGSSAPHFLRGASSQSEAESEAERQALAQSHGQRHSLAHRQGLGNKGGLPLSHSPSSRAQRLERLLKARGLRGHADGTPRLWRGRGLASDGAPYPPGLINATGANLGTAATHGHLGQAWAQQGEPGVQQQYASAVPYLGRSPGAPEIGGAGGGWGMGMAGAGGGYSSLSLSAAYQSRRDAGYLGSRDEDGLHRRRGGQRLMATARLSPAVVMQAGGGPQREAQVRSLMQARQLAVLQQARERAAAAAHGEHNGTPSANTPSVPGTPPPEDQGEEEREAPRKSPSVTETEEGPSVRTSLRLGSPSQRPREPPSSALGAEGDKGGEPQGYSSETSSRIRGSPAACRSPTPVASPGARPLSAGLGYGDGIPAFRPGSGRQDSITSGGADSMLRFGSVASTRRGSGMITSLSQSSNASVPASGPLGSAVGASGAVPAVGALPPGYRLFEAPSLDGLREEKERDARKGGRGGRQGGSRFRLRRVLSMGHASVSEDEGGDRLLRHRQSTMLRQQLLMNSLQLGREDLLLPRSLSILLPHREAAHEEEWGQEGGRGAREEGDGEERETVGELLSHRDRRKALGARPSTAGFRAEAELRRWQAVAGGEGPDMGAESEPEGGVSRREKRERRARSKGARAHGLGLSLSLKSSLSVAPHIKRAVTMSGHGPVPGGDQIAWHDSGLLQEHAQGQGAPPPGMGLVSAGDLIKRPLPHGPLVHQGLTPDFGLGLRLGLGQRPASFSAAGLSRGGAGMHGAEGVVVAGLVSFWLGFCVAALVGEMERKRLESELAQERESAAFLAHVTAVEWNRKQEAEREKVLAARDTGLELWKEPSISASTGPASGSRGARQSAGALEDEEPLAGPSSAGETMGRRLPRGASGGHGAPQAQRPAALGWDSDGFDGASGVPGEGEESEGLAGSRKTLDFSPSQEEGLPKRPSALQGDKEEASGAGASLDGSVSKEVREYVQGLERELEGAYSDLDLTLAELDGTKGELDEVLAELEACRADLEGLDMTRHKVKTLRVCLEILKQSERKAVGQAEGMKRELRKAESLLSHSGKEMRKLRQENASMRTALGALFLNLTMAVRATPPHSSQGTPFSPKVSPFPSPRGTPLSSPSMAPLVRPPSPLPPLRKSTPSLEL